MIRSYIFTWKNIGNLKCKGSWKEFIVFLAITLLINILLYLSALLFFPIDLENIMIDIITLFQFLSIVPFISLIIRILKNTI